MQINETEFWQNIRFNEQGLIPVITQDHVTKQVLMQAFMNDEALRLTLKDQRVCYWSRSRKALWLKGETSGHFQTLKAIYLDCDGDSILLEVEQSGVACHTGAMSCFFRMVKID